MCTFDGLQPSREVTVFVLPTVCLRAIGGEVGATSSLAPKIGPLGLVSVYHTIR